MEGRTLKKRQKANLEEGGTLTLGKVCACVFLKGSKEDRKAI